MPQGILGHIGGVSPLSLSLFSFSQPHGRKKGQEAKAKNFPSSMPFLKNKAAITGAIPILVDLSMLINAMKPTSQLSPPPCSADSTFWHADI